MISAESQVLQKMGETFASGFFEDRNAPVALKHSRAILRYFEAFDVAKIPQESKNYFPSGKLNIWRLTDPPLAFFFSHSFSVSFSLKLFEERIPVYLESERDITIAREVARDMSVIGYNPLSSKYSVGGSGYTHAMLNYEKLLSQGLSGYIADITKRLEKVDSEDKKFFYMALKETFDAIMLLLNKAINHYSGSNLGKTLKNIAERAPETFYEAMVLFNFIFYLDNSDSIGEMDVFLTPFYEKDIAAGKITEQEVIELVREFYVNVDDNSGWHMILGGRKAKSRLTELCLEAIDRRRPNTGLKINFWTSDEVWEKAFDSLERGSGNPAFYNDAAYRKSAVKYVGVNEADLDKIAYGGCTEFMIAGKSNVGSIDSGINLLEILDCSMKRLDSAADFGSFMDAFKSDIKYQVSRCIDETNMNQQYKALSRPQLIRSLFIDDCLESGVEYNAGGAKYNGGVINVAGIANTANSLYAIKQAYSGSIDISPSELMSLMENNYSDASKKREILRSLPKYGNNNSEVDSIAKDISEFAFSEILKYRCWRANGFYIPSVIMFVTYVNEGININATPEGRTAGGPISDSCGPMQGTDLEGATSMLQSTACLPHHKGLGTMVLNMRVNATMLKDQIQRKNLRSLLQTYFDMGGLQVQLSVLDAETLKQAEKYPEQYQNLVIRIGGYTEYFNRLSSALQKEVIARIEHEAN